MFLLDFIDETISIYILVISLVLTGLICTRQSSKDQFRRRIIECAEFASVFLVWLTTISAIWAGYRFGQTIESSASSPFNKPWIDAIVGGILGFVVASIVMSFLFLLHEIAENTRKAVEPKP
jgi:CDP-diglyceride synthetase